MNINLPFITIGSITAIIIFALMRNKQAGRNDKRRERLERRNEELMDLLKRNNSPTEKTTNDES